MIANEVPPVPHFLTLDRLTAADLTALLDASAAYKRGRPHGAAGFLNTAASRSR